MHQNVHGGDAGGRKIGRKIYKIGMNFSTRTKQIDRWKKSRSIQRDKNTSLME